MVADVLVMRADRERLTSLERRAKAAEAVQHVLDVAERIRAMTKLYQERLEGRRVRR